MGLVNFMAQSDRRSDSASDALHPLVLSFTGARLIRPVTIKKNTSQQNIQ